MTLTNQKVAAGIGEVQMAESQMQEMVATFARAAERMDGLNTTNQQQHTGLETLNASILELQDALTHSDRSIADSRHAASQLTSEATRLTESIGAFKLESGGADNADKAAEGEKELTLLTRAATTHSTTPWAV